MKKNILLVLLYIYVCPLAAMNSSCQEDEVSEVVKALTHEAQPKFQRTAALITYTPFFFPKQVSRKDFDVLKKLARPKYSFLLERLLKKQIVDANTFCEDNGKKFSLLGEAIDYFAQENGRNKSWTDTRAVRLLLKTADSNQEWHFTKSDGKKRTSCLARATETGSMSLVGHLLAAGADPNRVDESGQLPLNLSMKFYLVSRQREYFNIARELVRSGARPISKVCAEDFKLMRQLVYSQYLKMLQLLLQEKFLDARLSSDQLIGSTSLMDEAVKAVTSTTIQGIISSKDTEHDDIRVMQLMLSYGANLEEEYLCVAACSGAKKLVNLLLNLNVTPNCVGFAVQPLSMPTMYYINNGGSNYYDIITMLLGAGADPYFEFKDMQTPVDFAKTHIEFVNGFDEQGKNANSKRRAEVLLGLFARCEKK